jgi:hypothetical protein
MVVGLGEFAQEMLGSLTVVANEQMGSEELILGDKA